MTYFDKYGAKAFTLVRWFQETGNNIAEYVNDSNRLFACIKGIVFYSICLLFYCLSYVVGGVGVIFSFILGPLMDLITGCRFWNRNFEADFNAIEAITQKLPELDNEMIESYIKQELDAVGEYVNAKFSLLEAKVVVVPEFYVGKFVAESKNKTRYIPAHSSTSYCVRIYPREGPQNKV